MGATKKAELSDPSEETLLDELRQQIDEFCLIKDRMDALENLLEPRKKRIRLLMEDLGLSRAEADGGNSSFTERRSFEIVDAERLSELFDAHTLAANVKITADVYDAAKAEGIKIDEAVRVGRNPSLSVSRARSKQAKERRKQYIAESREQAEKRIDALRKKMRANKKKKR